MVQVVINRTQSGDIVAFTASGHAGYAPRGRDIVCAAVSALTQAAVIGLSRHAGVDATVSIDEDSGRLDCRIDMAAIDPERHIKAQAILETMMTGLVETARSYREHIRVKEVTET